MVVVPLLIVVTSSPWWLTIRPWMLSVAMVISTCIVFLPVCSSTFLIRSWMLPQLLVVIDSVVTIPL